MADAKVSKIGINSAVAAEEAAAPVADVAPAAEADVAPNVSERRVSGKREYPAPNGTVIVVEHN